MNFFNCNSPQGWTATAAFHLHSSFPFGSAFGDAWSWRHMGVVAKLKKKHYEFLQLQSQGWTIPAAFHLFSKASNKPSQENSK